jgi:hypothetical protein
MDIITDEDTRTIRDIAEYAGLVTTIYQKGDRRYLAINTDNVLDTIGKLIHATQGDIEQVEMLADAITCAVIQQAHEAQYLTFMGETLHDHEVEDD